MKILRFLSRSCAVLLNLYCGGYIIGLNNSAQAVVFNESIDSDIFTPIDVGNLDIGVNTISGSIPIATDGLDAYLFTLPKNTELVSVSIENFGPGSGGAPFVDIIDQIRLVRSSNNLFSGSLIEEITPGPDVGETIFFDTENLPSVETLFDTNYIIGNAGFSAGANTTLNYTYSLEVATQVPFDMSPNMGLLILAGIYGGSKLSKKLFLKRHKKLED